MFLSLTIICVVAGAILAGVNMYTTGPIAATKAAALEAAIKQSHRHSITNRQKMLIWLSRLTAIR